MKSLIYGIALVAIWTLSSCTNQVPTEKTMPTPTLSQAEARQLVQPFYDFLGGNATPEQVQPSYHEDWISYYDNDQGRTMAETIGFVSGPLAQMVPDLNWAIKEIYVTPENTIIVRGEATGTPAGDSFMGAPISGDQSFTFMSIDIHELKDGKILKTYHVEDWLSAIQQVSAQ